MTALIIPIGRQRCVKISVALYLTLL